jgi:hypothetical protein
MHLKIVGRIANVELVASGKAIRERKRLWKVYGRARWRKLKALPTCNSQMVRYAMRKIHWYEAHGIGAKEYKIKRIID